MKCDKLFSNIAFNCSLRHYNEANTNEKSSNHIEDERVFDVWNNVYLVG